MRKRAAADGHRSAAPGLTLHATTEKAEALLKERARLLREVSKKKEQVTQARAEADRVAQVTAVNMGPLIARHETLVHELGALFDELLSKGRLAAKAQKQVLQVRNALEQQGVLPPLSGRDEREDEAPLPWDADAPNNHRAGPAAESTEASERRRRRSPAAEAAQRDVASAHQPSPERRSLRELFRSLASAVHPDRAREEAEQKRRTELMKEVTRAYEAGDLARLIELEDAWQSERVLAGDGDPEKRCRELQRVNRELLDQVRALTRALRDVKREARESAFGSLASMLEQAQHELDELAAVRDFVRKFRDGKISLSAFVQGPPDTFAADEFLAITFASLFLEELNTGHEQAPKRRPRKSQRR